ncbi:MAG: hypothetical protein QXR85_01345, partial [Candidatus Micrarchaeaceae archaeon]
LHAFMQLEEEVHRMEKLPRKPNVQFWCKIMLWHAPVISRYARQKLEKWYWEDEPKVLEAQRATYSNMQQNSSALFAQRQK